MNLLKKYLTLLLLSALGYTQGFNHPELEWQTIEGEHFIIHYHQHTAWTANEALHVAEDVYPYITALYDYEPEEKTHIMIRDTDDYANGGAYYYDNKMEIWAMPLDYELRGSHYWLRDVITHEFTHIISLRASRRMPASIPAAYLQVISYEPERREDVLYGYPNGIASYPVPSVSVPMWWAEGIAQHQTDAMRWDWWDSIRDMMLRDRIKYDKVLTLNEMDGFGKVGIGNESVYDHGFGFVNYLVERFGADVLKRITDRLAHPLGFSFYKALRTETGVAPEMLWDGWIESLVMTQSKSYPAGEAKTELEFINRAGDANFTPRWNAHGSTLGFISSKGETYLSRTSLFIQEAGGKVEKLVPTAEGFDWAPDGERLVYARKDFYDGGIPAPRATDIHSHHMPGFLDVHKAETCERCNIAFSGSRFADLFIAHKDSIDDEIQLTHGERVKNPSWSPDGQSIAFVNLRDGTNNLCLAYPDHPDSILQITNFLPGTQVYVPRWSPDSKYIVFDFTGGSNRDIALYDVEAGSMEIHLEEDWDERNPAFLDAQTLVYSDDRTGIFNLYTKELNSGENQRLTNVDGGLFHPEYHDGYLYCSAYDSLGYRIARIDLNDLVSINTLAVSASTDRIIEPTWKRHLNPITPKPYDVQVGPMFLLPKLQIEIDEEKNTTIYKPGFYFFSDEIISNYSVIGGFGLAPNRDMDLFLSAQYKKLLPTLSMEFYQMVRNTHFEFEHRLSDHSAPYPAEADFKFSLTQGVLSASLTVPPFSSFKIDATASTYRQTVQPYSFEGSSGTIHQDRVSWTYFKGTDFGMRWDYSKINPRAERGINPSGSKATLSLRHNRHNFISWAEGGSLNWWQNFLLHTYSKLSFKSFYGYLLPLPGQFVFSNSTDINLIDNNAIDDFFWEFGGGRPGLRAYPFYSMKGTRQFVSTFTLRFPLFRDSYRKLAHITVRDLYLGLHAQVGDAWSADPAKVDVQQLTEWMNHEYEQVNLKRDLGLDLRLNLNSYYAFPTAVEFGAYYGLDEVNVTTADELEYRYGGEWRYYWSILFGFE